MDMETVPNGSSPSSTTSNSAVTPTTTSAAAAAVAAAAAAISPNAPSSKLNQLKESLKLEHQFLRVPFEHYKKAIRANHRIVEKEVSAVINGVSDAADSDLSRDDAVQHLHSLVSRLQGLKRKVLRVAQLRYSVRLLFNFGLRKLNFYQIHTYSNIYN